MNDNDHSVSQEKIKWLELIIVWTSKNPLKFTSLLGGTIYVLVFESYRSVLRPYGVTPADVGIDYMDVIWPVVQSFGFLVFALVLVIAFIALKFLKIRTYLVQSHERRVGMAIVSVFFITVLLSGLATSEMVQYRKSIEHGRAYDPIFSSRLQVLAGLRANRVNVAWKGGIDARPSIPTSAILFLGAADGISIFYSYSSEEILRIPSHDIVLTEMMAQGSKAANQQPGGNEAEQ